MTSWPRIVKSLDPAITILNLLVLFADGMRLSELAAAVLPLSTSHLLLSPMDRWRFVQFDSHPSS